MQPTRRLLYAAGLAVNGPKSAQALVCHHSTALVLSCSAPPAEVLDSSYTHIQCTYLRRAFAPVSSNATCPTPALPKQHHYLVSLPKVTWLVLLLCPMSLSSSSQIGEVAREELVRSDSQMANAVNWRRDTPGWPQIAAADCSSLSGSSSTGS
jgi:hypothetical protein